MRCRNICHRIGRLNLVPAIARLAGKYAQIAINLMTRAGLVANSFAAPVDANRRRCGFACQVVWGRLLSRVQSLSARRGPGFELLVLIQAGSRTWLRILRKVPQSR